MRIAYWDCFSGIAGDMLLGALVGCGLDPDDLRQDLAGLALEGYRIEHRKVRRGTLVADKVDVVLAGEGRAGDGGHRHDHGPAGGEGSVGGGGHEHDHGLAAGEGRAGDGDHRHDHGAARGAGSHAHHHGRGLPEIRAILGASDLPEPVLEGADAAFLALCRAEAEVHGQAVDEVHLHEAGAIDAIVDIVGACAGLHRLGVESVVCSPLNVGAGEVEVAHGVLPVPAPATALLLKGAPVYSRGPRAELVTPTGATLVAVLADSFGPWPELTVEAVGYGAGDLDFDDRPNVFRMVLGQRGGPGAHTGHDGDIQVLETNIDDMDPRIFGTLVPRLLEAGALDVYTTPVLMKKGRPGQQLTILAPAEALDPVAELVFRETTTLGLRTWTVGRRELHRRHETVRTPWGEVRVKVASLGDSDVNVAPEYDDCEALASKVGVPVKRVLQAAVTAWEHHGSRGTS